MLLGIIGAEAWLDESFNPHPTRRPGATQAIEESFSAFTMFQSSPDPEAGCYVLSQASRSLYTTFQSSPDPEAGCYRRWAGRDLS